MKRGKRELPSKRNYKGKTALVALVLIFCCTVGGTLAWLVAATGPVENTFTPAHVTCQVNETFKDGTKSDVKIQNTGNIDAYIRAAIVVNWADKDGNVYGTTPAENDYTMTMTLKLSDTGWQEGNDGYYYYANRVKPGAKTSELIKSCSPVEGKAPAGYNLQVTILADAIQADGVDGRSTPAVETVWTNVKVKSDGTLTVKS